MLLFENVSTCEMEKAKMKKKMIEIEPTGYSSFRTGSIYFVTKSSIRTDIQCTIVHTIFPIGTVDASCNYQFNNKKYD